ncbi:DUF5684 domain-containing protein [Geofilum rhodophaeum]|uniref:DUF5684 domain-containing protein n=1 Tax=Geofilum rhodophaeum TaxID=1965019 RepID=UPI000B52285D|nr:DUF5684 domain-containing protein [Geofilum rhodophaeum]
MDNLFLYSMLSMLLTLVSIATFWQIFEKAGQAGWKSLIPVYNILVFLQIINKPWWWIFLFMLPLINLIFGIWATNLLSKRFGLSAWFTLGILFLPFLFLPVLAFGKARYQKQD